VFSNCPLQLKFPRKCKEKLKDNTVCGKDHHYLLHFEKKEGANNNNRNQNTGNTEEQQPPK
jgi:hypothetical protein